MLKGGEAGRTTVGDSASLLPEGFSSRQSEKESEGGRDRDGS